MGVDWKGTSETVCCCYKFFVSISFFSCFAIYLYIAEIFVTGHRVYQKGTEAFHAIVEEFGSSIVTDSGEIDRKKLGAIVFSDMVIESF